MTQFPIGLHRPVEHPGPLPEAADAVIIGAGVIGVMTAYYPPWPARRYARAR